MRILVIPDTHSPYHHPATFEFLRKIRKQFKTDCTVHIGDEIDAHAWSRYAKNPQAYGAADELRQAKASLAELKDFDSRIKFCISNHQRRAYTQIATLGVPEDFLRPWHEVIGAPKGWSWADEHHLDGVRFFHGEGYLGAQATALAAFDSRTNCVLGHVHTAAGVYYCTRGFNRWALSVGCLIDPSCPVYDYARRNRAKPALGCGVVLDGIPMFIPLEK